MIPGAARSASLLACLCVVAAFQVPVPAAPPQRPPGSPPPPGAAAILVIDLPSGRVLSAVQPDTLAKPVAPGSIMHVATLVAALESGVVSADTRWTCRRRTMVGGRQIACAHPDLHRPLSPADALAYSCNDFFASIAERVPRERLDAVTTALGLGAIARDVPMPILALGLDGVRATPEQWLRAFVRAADTIGGARMRPDTREVLREGLRGAARYGSARTIGDRGIDALATSGTAGLAGGPGQGLALAISPAARSSRAVAVLVPGGSDVDAASTAAETLAQLIAGTYGTGAGPNAPPSPRRGASPSLRADAPSPGAVGRPAGVTGRASRPPVQVGQAEGPSPGGTTMRIGRARGRGYEVVQVPLEEYVARVIAGEAAPRSAPAALEALAIAVRTFATANAGRHRADGFDLCDQTHCQVMGTATEATRQAATATGGQILTYAGRPAAIFYTACCGGQSETASEVWPRAQDQPFLTQHKDKACRQLPEWTSEIAESELLRALHAAGYLGDRLRDIRVGRRSGSGRASTLRVEGLMPGEITGDDLRLSVGRTLGWQLLKSTAFDITRTPLGYRFSGRGYGHGVGLCVVGSVRMATEGRSAAQILQEYFPGTKIVRLPADSTRLP